MSTAEAQAAVDVCRAASVPLSVAYYRRYWPVVQEMRRLLAGGAIGEVVQARVQLADQYVPDPERSWLTEPEQAGGGALANAGSHWVDLIRYLLGEVVEVTAACSEHFGGFKTEDTIGVQMRSGAAGAGVAQRDAVFARGRERIRHRRHGRAFVRQPALRWPPHAAAGQS